jgi:hypothetical protein
MVSRIADSHQGGNTDRSLQLLVLLTMFCSVAVAASAQSTSQLRGSWRATEGTRVFQGTWTADVNVNTPDLAQGSWTVIEGNRVVLRGTWSAKKDRARWRGTWSALVAPVRPGAPPISGTWQTNIKSSAADTLTDMLQRAAKTQIDGTWRSGRMAGSWSIVR